MTTAPPPKPFYPTPAPTLEAPPVVQHTPAPWRDTTARYLLAAACVVLLPAVALVAVWLPWPFSPVAWAATVVLGAGGVVFGHPLLVEMQHAVLGVAAHRLEIWHRDAALELVRAVVKRHARFVYRVVAPRPAPPDYVVINGQPINKRAETAAWGVGDSTGHPGGSQGQAARYAEPGQTERTTQRLEPIALPPGNWTDEMRAVAAVGREHGSVAFSLCKAVAGLSQSRWQRGCEGLAELGIISRLGPGKGYSWRG